MTLRSRRLRQRTEKQSGRVAVDSRHPPKKWNMEGIIPAPSRRANQRTRRGHMGSPARVRERRSKKKTSGWPRVDTMDVRSCNATTTIRGATATAHTRTKRGCISKENHSLVSPNGPPDGGAMEPRSTGKPVMMVAALILDVVDDITAIPGRSG